MIVDENHPIKAKINVGRNMTQLTEMIGEEDMTEFFAHGVTVEESTRRSELTSDFDVTSPKHYLPPKQSNKDILVHFKNPLSHPEKRLVAYH